MHIAQVENKFLDSSLPLNITREHWEQEQGRSESGAQAGQEQKGGRSRPELGHEQGRSMAGGQSRSILILSNIGPMQYFKSTSKSQAGQERSRSRERAGQEHGGSKAGIGAQYQPHTKLVGVKHKDYFAIGQFWLVSLLARKIPVAISNSFYVVF